MSDSPSAASNEGLRRRRRSKREKATASEEEQPPPAPATTATQQPQQQAQRHPNVEDDGDDIWTVCVPLFTLILLSLTLLVAGLWATGNLDGMYYGGQPSAAGGGFFPGQDPRAMPAGPVDHSDGDATHFGGRKVRDTQLRLRVGLADLFLGREVEVDVQRSVVCPVCHGDGADPDAGMDTCPHCNGRGVRTYMQRFGQFQQRVQSHCQHCSGKGQIPGRHCSNCHGKGHFERQKHSVSVKVEPGMQNDDQVRLVGEGNQHPTAAAGDVVFFLEAERHRTFTRSVHDLEASISISLREALLGFSQTLRHLDDRPVTVSRSEVTPPGFVVVLPDQGMPIRYTTARGVLRVTVNVNFPRFLSREQRALVEKLLSNSE